MPDAPPLKKPSVEQALGETAMVRSQSGSGPGGERAGNEGTGPEGGDRRVRYFKELFREEWDKPFWKDLREQVPIDFGYYTGSGQWTDAQRSEAKSKSRPTLTINHIQPTCNALFGIERMNRYDPIAAPKAKDDVGVAELFTRLLKQSMDEANGEYILSQGFADGVIGGVVGFEMPIDYTDDPIKGTIDFSVVKCPEEWIWCTPWNKYDLSDTRGMFRHRWVDVDLLCSQYPDREEAIVAALSKIKNQTMAQDASKEGAVLTEGNPKDHYETSDYSSPQQDMDFWFDVSKNRVRVLDVYYPEFYPLWLLADKDGKQVYHTTSETKLKRYMQAVADRSKGVLDWQVIERYQRKIHALCCLAATDYVLEEGIPFRMDETSYPIIPFFAYWRGNEVYGVVRNLRDPQDEVNARRSQISWLTKASGDGWFVDENTVTNLDAFERESRDPKGVYTVKKQARLPSRIPPPNIPQGLFEVLVAAVNEIRQISMVNTEMQGGEGHAVSGVAKKLQVQQGNIGNNELFDNFRFTKRLVWTKMARRIQEKYSDEDVVRLVNPETAEFEFIEVNKPVGPEPSETPTAGLRHKVLNDISTLRYDLKVTETPISATHRQGALANLLELMQKVPAVAPYLMAAIVEMTDGLPDRDKLVAQVRALAKSLTEPKPSPPPKTSISLKGEDIPEEARVALAHKALNEPDPRTKQNPLGEEAGNVQNPSGQLPTGGQKLTERADLPPSATGV
jgi:hypothetical protein